MASPNRVTGPGCQRVPGSTTRMVRWVLLSGSADSTRARSSGCQPVMRDSAASCGDVGSGVGHARSSTSAPCRPPRPASRGHRLRAAEADSGTPAPGAGRGFAGGGLRRGHRRPQLRQPARPVTEPRSAAHLAGRAGLGRAPLGRGARCADHRGGSASARCAGTWITETVARHKANRHLIRARMTPKWAGVRRGRIPCPFAPAVMPSRPVPPGCRAATMVPPGFRGSRPRPAREAPRRDGAPGSLRAALPTAARSPWAINTCCVSYPRDLPGVANFAGRKWTSPFG
ncbi:hypothetical protein JOF53_007385 [Crossiella equi]|uniref:Uncharacterized protein n=1 Tax=Crossiella equi TaxID=130796 RepID=A0ABS5APL3_9PSEU|nr:hypothetical protein [Crossiella equi]